MKYPDEHCYDCIHAYKCNREIENNRYKECTSYSRRTLKRTQTEVIEVTKEEYYKRLENWIVTNQRMKKQKKNLEVFFSDLEDGFIAVDNRIGRFVVAIRNDKNSAVGQCVEWLNGNIYE